MFFNKNKFYHILTLKDHKKYRDLILREIDRFYFPYQNMIGSVATSFVSNTDWTKSSTEWIGKYVSLEDKKRIYKFLQKKFKIENPAIVQDWYNQYFPNSGSSHSSHTHEFCTASGIYFVEHQDPSLTTILYDPKNGKKIQPKIKEGDILFFNSKIIHESPPNNGSFRKTVIAFNISAE